MSYCFSTSCRACPVSSVLLCSLPSTPCSRRMTTSHLRRSHDAPRHSKAPARRSGVVGGSISNIEMIRRSRQVVLGVNAYWTSIVRSIADRNVKCKFSLSNSKGRYLLATTSVRSGKQVFLLYPSCLCLPPLQCSPVSMPRPLLTNNPLDSYRNHLPKYRCCYIGCSIARRIAVTMTSVCCARMSQVWSSTYTRPVAGQSSWREDG